MQVSVLGVTEVRRGDDRVDLGTRKRRALVAALALSGGRPVSTDALVDLLWGDHPPEAVAGALQVYVSGLRRVLEPERPPRAPASVLVTVTPGYALRLPAESLDADRFDSTVSAAHRRLGRTDRVGTAPSLSGVDLADVVAGLDEALALWRGVPYVDLEDAPAAVAERTRLEELRLVALEDRASAALALGDHGTVAAELEALTAAHPLRERLWALRALALTRSGRQADALDALRHVREVLDTELGLEPGAELRELQTAVLRQDPALAWVPPSGGPVPVAERLPTVAPPAAQVADRPPDLPAWPLVGRDTQLDDLVAALERARGANVTFAALTGEPGIGKSRLCAELAHRAAAPTEGTGTLVLLGRCSQDEGAPPLWPWQQVLSGLGADLPSVASDDEGAEFRTWEAIRDQVLGAARQQPVLLVLDDLHWADVPSLRVLRLMVESVERAVGASLMVVLTWRSQPQPTGALADVAEALGRRHAERVHLTGLVAAEAAEVVGAVATVRPTGEQAERLVTRTDGNPFFLVEYARLARERGDLDALMEEAAAPTAVHEVVTRRVDRLPEDARSLLRWAAVVGREFELSVLAHATGVPEDDVLDRLDPALAAGLVREEGIGRYVFGHALVRDTVYDSWSATRRARAHARVAEVLEDRAGRETEVARHWVDAGPAHAGRAWRAASAAAAEVMRTRNAYGVASDLLASALACLEQDPEATLEDRYRLLMERTDTHRWQGDWITLLDTAMAAIEVAERLDDVCRLADAASSMTIGALWQSPAHGADHPVVIAALRRSLDELPPAEVERRCRALVALAAEAYYKSPPAEREALVEEALALARRTGDDALLLHTLLIGYVATWRPATADLRLALGLEAIELAGRLGDERSLVIAQTLTAVVHGELGQVDRMWELSLPAREAATRLHLNYPLLVLHALHIPWLAQASELDEAETLLAATRRLVPELRIVQTGLAELGALVSIYMWSGRNEEVAGLMGLVQDESLPMVAAAVAMLDRAGLTEQAVAHAAGRVVDLDQDNWYSMMNWSCSAEVSLVLGDRDLAAAAYDRLAPYRGRSASAGSGTALGPVDAFLAHAAAAVGDLDLAAAHADDALRLCGEWRIPLAAQWLRGQRDRFGF
ncbi:MAG TPA: BTAD domain-containing putative transcriptional regulator [Nocardioides sp.]|nr:BTAD domain-containing putative transcriptional regulator [Nocardioides sp.]